MTCRCSDMLPGLTSPAHQTSEMGGRNEVVLRYLKWWQAVNRQHETQETAAAMRHRFLFHRPLPGCGRPDRNLSARRGTALHLLWKYKSSGTAELDHLFKNRRETLFITMHAHKHGGGMFSTVASTQEGDGSDPGSFSNMMPLIYSCQVLEFRCLFSSC